LYPTISIAKHLVHSVPAPHKWFNRKLAVARTEAQYCKRATEIQRTSAQARDYVVPG
ncbi:hypothetical protein PCANC_28437, partial [Puccinia coronata f. sp. avenae]